MTAFTLCEKCEVPIGASENAHQSHGSDCNRFLNGFCRCDGWLCIRCCPDEVCGPLAAVLIEAREDVRARAEEAELAAEAS